MKESKGAENVRHRKQHFWKIRNEGCRDLFIKRGWHFHGGYASKTIAGKTAMAFIIKTYPDHLLCSFQFKEDFWKALIKHHENDKDLIKVGE